MNRKHEHNTFPQRASELIYCQKTFKTFVKNIFVSIFSVFFFLIWKVAWAKYQCKPSVLFRIFGNILVQLCMEIFSQITYSCYLYSRKNLTNHIKYVIVEYVLVINKYNFQFSLNQEGSGIGYDS